MKAIVWLGNTHKLIQNYPPDVKREAGYNLDKIQRGLEAIDWKPMLSIGHGVKEIRIHVENEYRILYVAKFSEAIYVLHTFMKKTEKTAQRDIDLAKERYTLMLNIRRVK